MLGDRIKTLREQNGIGVNELARMANMNASYISAIERNVKTNPSIDVLEKIATALQVSVSDILTNPENSYSIELLTDIQNSYSNKFNSINNYDFLSMLSKELDIDEKELYMVYNDKSTDLPLEIQIKLLNYLKGLDIDAYTIFMLQYAPIDTPEETFEVDEDMKAIIEALKKASPNKKAKILKMIKLFDDEN